MTALWRHRMERSGLDLAVIARSVNYILFDWPRITSVHSKITPLFGPPSVWMIYNLGEIINLRSDRNSCDDKIIIHDVISRLVEDLFMLNFVTLISFFSVISNGIILILCELIRYCFQYNYGKWVKIRHLAICHALHALPSHSRLSQIYRLLLKIGVGQL